MLARRDALSAAARKSCSTLITKRLLVLDAYRGASCVMAYVTFGSEFETGDFIADLLAHGKKLVLPRVERGSRVLTLHEVQDPRLQLEAGVWGIRQPRADCPVAAASQVDFVLVPGVAFTERCERLGYGGGFYDRFIGGLASRPALIAAAYSPQLVPALPLTKSDQRVERVVTESGEYRHTEGIGNGE